MYWVNFSFVKCQNCYAQIKTGSIICDYCGSQVTFKKSSNNNENVTKSNSVSLKDEERLSPEFRQILGYDSSQVKSSELEEINHQEKKPFDNTYFVKRPSRKWGVTQTIIEFFIYCILFNLLEGYYQQQDVVVGIYLLWSFIRAFNFFVLKRSNSQNKS